MPRPVQYALFAVYLVALALIAYWPSTVDGGVDDRIYAVIDWCARNGLGFVTYDRIERVANVLLFVPFGLLLAGLLPRGRRAWAILIAIGVSVVIEVGQLLFLPSRYPSVTDIVTNSLGATIGVVIVLLAGAARARRRRRLAGAPAEASDSRYRGEHQV